MVNQPNESRESDDLRRTLAALQRRLDRIERHLGLRHETAREHSPPAAQETSSAPETIAPPIPAAPSVVPPAIEKTQNPIAAAAPPIAPPISTSQETYQVEGREAPPSVPPLRRPPVVSQTTKPDRGGLEIMIAAKWFAWIGAIIIVLGAGFALREFGANLWVQLSPAAKCVLVAAFGFALLGGGEIALRKLGRVASVGLFSAGLGVLYLDAYATYQFFNPPLLPRGWSFVLAGATALFGFLITLRTRSLTIGILSLIAGYLAPVLLGAPDEHVIETLLYLTLLLGIGLALSAAAPRPFRALRYISIVFHLLVAGGWMAGEAAHHWQLSLIFMSAWWAMVLGEATLAALRRQSPIGNAVAVFIATACYVTAGCLVLDGALPPGTNWLGLYTAGVAVICIVTALQFGPGLDALRRTPQFPMDKLAVALLVQSAALIAVAIALHFDGYGRTIGWLAVAVASIELGNRLRSRGLDIFGIILGTIALLMVVTVDRLFSTVLATELWTFDAARWNIIIDRWTLLVIGAIVVTHFAAQRLRVGSGFWKVAPALTACVGTFYWLMLCFAATNGLATTTGWLLGATALIATRSLNPRTYYIEQALAVLLIAASRWVIVDAFAYRMHANWHADSARAFLNGQLAAAALIAGGLFIVSRLWPNNKSFASKPQSVTTSLLAQPLSLQSSLQILALILLMFGVSFEIEHALSLHELRATVQSAWPGSLLRAFWITIFMSVGGGAIMFLGQARRAWNTMTTGLAFIVLSALAWLTFETLGGASSHGVVDTAVMINIQFMTGVACAISLAVAAHLLQKKLTDMKHADASATDLRNDRMFQITGVCFIGAIGLWLGSLEIARAFHGQRMATQMGFSVYWGLYAVALVIIGFVRNSPAARYVGLGLLGVTVVKVLTVDLATVDKIWRVVSLLVTGLLAVGVSIGYVKLSPKLDAQHDDEIEKAGQ